MAPARSFDIELLEDFEPLKEDLEALGPGRDRWLRRLNGLGDEDMHDWVRVPVPRGLKGSWVLVRVGGRTAMSQFAKGMPRQWPRGLGRGCLTVVRVIESNAVDDVLRELGDEA
jgi:hypothetical protein